MSDRLSGGSASKDFVVKYSAKKYNNIKIKVLKLTADNITDDAFQWVDFNLNYTQIDGETNITFTAIETDNYAVVIESNTCIDTSACNSINISGILIWDFSKK